MNSKMTLDEYQTSAAQTADYPEAGTHSQAARTYAVLGLAGEAGELADKWKKVMRGDHPEGVTAEVSNKLLLEVGDVLWYCARVCAELGVGLSMAAQMNVEKLASRQARGVLKGSGDHR